ncbi:hypothetical protein PJE062_2309 [Pseudovibrio sp. JE062]|nr:hypothetical protein PJE062_2309 [Pseudovibrio sp. JE062]
MVNTTQGFSYSRLTNCNKTHFILKTAKACTLVKVSRG